MYNYDTNKKNKCYMYYQYECYFLNVMHKSLAFHTSAIYVLANSSTTHAPNEQSHQ